MQDLIKGDNFNRRHSKPKLETSVRRNEQAKLLYAETMGQVAV